MNPKEITELRTKLMRLAKSLRVCVIPDDADLEKPQSWRDDQVLRGNKMIKRRRIVLLTPKCSSASCLMCPLPNEALDSSTRPITPQQIIKQFDSCFEGIIDPGIEMVTIYTNGNFFADIEVPPEVREHIYKYVGSTKIKYLLVETLPQFISEEKMNIAKKYLGDRVLVAAVGLQSSNDLVRQISVNTTCTKESFETAYHLLKKNNFEIDAFLMIKPPFLSENEAIKDTVSSIGYLDSLGITNPILCSTRVAPNTVLEILAKDGKFRPPWLWTVVEVLKQCSEHYPSCYPRVVINELSSEKNPESDVSYNCPVCSAEVVEAINGFNSSRDINKLSRITHDCYQNYLENKQKEDIYTSHNPLQKRVQDFVDFHLDLLTTTSSPSI